jgi:hypothetical protein
MAQIVTTAGIDVSKHWLDIQGIRIWKSLDLR